MREQKTRSATLIIAIFLLMTLGGIVSAGDSAPATGPRATDSAQQSSGDAEGISPGTAITKENWRNYRQFMPDGMAALNCAVIA